jgi:hypothetical protein
MRKRSEYFRFVNLLVFCFLVLSVFICVHPWSQNLFSFSALCLCASVADSTRPGA